MQIPGTTTFALFLICAACNDPAVTPPTDPQLAARILEQAQASLTAMRQGDLEYVVDHMPAVFLRAGGGRAKMLSQLKSLNPTTKALGQDMLRHWKFHPAGPVHKVGAHLVSVLQYDSRTQFRGKLHDMTACWVAFSTDGGTRWTFASGSRASRAFIQKQLPEIYAAIESELTAVTVPGIGTAR